MPGATVAMLPTEDLDADDRLETITVSIVTDNSNLFTIDDTNNPVSLKLKTGADMSPYDVDGTNTGTLSFSLTIRLVYIRMHLSFVGILHLSVKKLIQNYVANMILTII